MLNKVVLHADGYIAHTYVGDQTNLTILAVMRKTAPLADRLRAGGRPARILADIRRVGTISTGARKAAVEALAKAAYDKIAIYGATSFTKAIVNLIAHASRRSEIVKVFNTRAEALRWLSNHGE